MARAEDPADRRRQAIWPTRSCSTASISSIEPGESVAIIGGSGTGKSVTLKCILGLLKPERGSIKVDGEELLGAPSRERARIAREIRHAVPGRRAVQFDAGLAQRHLRADPGRGRRMRRGCATSRWRISSVSASAARCSTCARRELSGGMQKRVALARAIAPRPEIIFFDEPTTGLDPIRADVINDLIVSLVEDLGVTALTITHDMASARKIAHRVAMLYQGRIIWSGPRDRLYDSAAGRLVPLRIAVGETGEPTTRRLCHRR